MKKLLSVLFLAFIFISTQAKYISADQRPWSAQWIAAKDDSGTGYGVYYFRKSVVFTNKPTTFRVHVSADNRYKLYINGKIVSMGPARGDTYFWNYETIDIAPYLTSGKNAITALVWNEAQYRPEAQITVRTSFILQGQSEKEDIVNTNETWKCMKDEGSQPIPGYFFAASKGQLIDMNKTLSGDWTSLDFADDKWGNAAKVGEGKLKGMAWGIDWALVPSTLPAMEMTYQRIQKLRSADGIKVPATFPAKKTAINIPANTKVTLLLDQTFLTNAYITLNFSGGKDAGISLGYAESLYKKGTKGVEKGNRNETDGKEFIGRIDSIIANGTKGQSFTTLNFRTFRYIKVIVQTKKDPLIIDDLYGTFTGYPFKEEAKFNTDNTEINQMLDIGWRTARLNAWESYMDCPYYEQLQYIGDSRIQVMVSYFNSSDDRLARNALTHIDHSRIAEGITRSCYPTKGTQIIPMFSLWYIGMLHDYWMYKADDGFIKDKLVGGRAILDFFGKYQQADGSLYNVPYWAFVDWAGNMWAESRDESGSGAIYNLQLLYAYQWAAEMEAKIGLQDYANIYKAKAEQLKATIQRKYWNPAKKLYADTKDQNSYSQHVNSLAILTGMLNKDDMKIVANGMLNDESLTKCSVYFKYYLNQALVKSGLGNDYMKWLDIYRENIAMGLTTWAEYSDVNTSRSDCHAWGSSPNIEFYRVVLGIDSDAPGFSKVKIEPHLGTMTKVGGEMPHPNGKVAVNYELKKGKWQIGINLPTATTGKLIWKGKTYELKVGTNTLII